MGIAEEALVDLTRNQQLAMEDALQALTYLFAAERVLGNEYEHFSSDLSFLSPASFLVAHAVELGLNAFLSFNGTKGGKGNHDLQGRLSAAEAAGLAVTEDFQTYVKIVNEPHKSGHFRYARDTGFSFMSPRKALDIVRPVLESIQASIQQQASSREKF
jgi:hypothetical protein